MPSNQNKLNLELLSTSYLFSYGPFYHTGIKADFAISDKIGLRAFDLILNTDFFILDRFYFTSIIFGHFFFKIKQIVERKKLLRDESPTDYFTATAKLQQNCSSKSDSIP